MFDCIIVGAGIAGATAARVLADNGKKILVVEKRGCIAGNCFDRRDEHGILVQEYGPHIFHTDIDEVFSFLSRFTSWRSFRHKVTARIGDRLVPVPFNLKSVETIFPEDADILVKKLIAAFGEGGRISVMQLREHDDPDIRKVADYVYENMYLHYTSKQWGLSPDRISPDVTARVPVVIGYDDAYFPDKYQGVPEQGFTAMFERMLDHENITVQLNTDMKDVLTIDSGTIRYLNRDYSGRVIYTGALDELFGYIYGRLPYRSLDFRMEHLDRQSFQGCAVVNYTVSEEFTRITEFKYLTGLEHTDGTTIVREYPFAYAGREGEEPYYPIESAESMQLYKKYRKLADACGGLHVLGRLAEYKYSNIDVMCQKAICMAQGILL